MDNKKREIPQKNYLICGLLFLGLILGTLYAFKWNEVKKQEKLVESYLIKTNTVSLTINTLEELESTLVEVPYDFFIFTGYTGDLDEYNLEVDLKPIIDDYKLADKFYYLNITDTKEEEDFLEDLSDLLDAKISSIPTIIYVSNDKVSNKITKDDEYLKASDFEKLLEIYDFEKSE